jgi:isoquinoline 1-oxidoreductase
MKTLPQDQLGIAPDPSEMAEGIEYVFSLDRRTFVQVLGAGLAIVVTPLSAVAQGRRGRQAVGASTVAARIHLGDDGTITLLTGKVEGGQGARAELAQAAAEELRVSPDRVRVVMSDTGLVPDDGITAGSRTTPSTVPAVRQGAAAARRLLVGMAAKQWEVTPESIGAGDGVIRHDPSQRSVTYAELARTHDVPEAFGEAIPEGVELTPVNQWRVMGKSVGRPNGRDLVTGSHEFPSDYSRPGMLYGKVLRAPSYGAKLLSVDLAPVQAMEDVVAVRDGDFAGVAAPTTLLAEEALDLLEQLAKWETAPHPSSREVHQYLRENAEGGVPTNPFADDVARSHRSLRATYHTAYIQHAPMETRSALAEWDDGKLTVWTGTQAPFRYRSELARAFRIPEEQVRVIVPDFGGGFGGKHSGETAVEAARLAQAARKPVLLRWTRREEFIWAYFRPAAVIDAEASLDSDGRLTTWHFLNINSGGSAVESPYAIEKSRSRFIGSRAPLRHGSYRTLAATANTFARESFMDELAAAAGRDPLEFRLMHLENPRLRAVLEEAARRFGWSERARQKQPGVGVGMACGTEKGSYVAACVEVAADALKGEISVRKVCEVFECGAIVNPDNLRTQVMSCILMGLGPVLREAMEFEEGRMRNAAFSRYLVPRFEDVPELDIHLLDRPDLQSAGGGETPIIAVAPAIANAVFRATGKRLREMPLRFENGASA